MAKLVETQASECLASELVDRYVSEAMRELARTFFEQTFRGRPRCDDVLVVQIPLRLDESSAVGIGGLCARSLENR